jgi:acyl-CoA reductase-like NAD-dependent aldehyde dehydrogenase
VHGIPSRKRVLRDGDIVKLDFGVKLEGMYTDSAITVPVGEIYEPTILIGDNSMRIAQEEIFGPVMTVIPYSGNDDDAVRIANDSIYGLGGGVIANHTGRAFNVARQIRTGMLAVQGVASDPQAAAGAGAGQGPGWGSTPAGIGQEAAFGGFKQSGLGREWGHHGLEDFTEIKNISWS